MPTTQVVRRIVAPARKPAASQPSAAQMIKKYRNAQSWTMFDRRMIGAVAFPGDPAAFNFAQWNTPLPFFSVRTLGNAGPAFTSNSDSNKFDRDFVTFSIAVDVSCDADAPSAPGIATAQAFVNAIVQGCALEIRIGSDPLLMVPLSDCPAGGGVQMYSRVRTQAVAAPTDGGGANNGIADARARKYLREPIAFKQGTAFAILIHTTPIALALIQALTPLAGNQFASVCLKFEGVRGTPLLEGVSANPGMLAGYAGQR